MKICFTIQQRKIMLGLIRPSFVQFCCKSKVYYNTIIPHFKRKVNGSSKEIDTHFAQCL